MRKGRGHGTGEREERIELNRDGQFLVGEDEGQEREEEKRNRDAALGQR